MGEIYKTLYQLGLDGILFSNKINLVLLPKKILLPFVPENVKIQPHFNTMKKKNTIESILILFKKNCDLSNW